MFEPDANLTGSAALRTDLPTRVRCAMTRTAPCFASPNGTVRHSLSADDRHAARCVTERSEAMKDKDRTSEREYQDRLESLLKNAFNTQLQPLRSLKTATKKRRAQKKGGKQFWVHEIDDDDFRRTGASRAF